MDIEEIREMGEQLKDILKLDTSPVAVTFIGPDEDIPAGIPRIKGELRHCGMVDRARKEKEAFYALVEDQECNIGASSLGMGGRCSEISSGEFYYSFGCFGSLEAAKSAIDEMPLMPAGSVKAVVYSALEKAPLVPDVVVIVAGPDKIMKLSQAVLYRFGGRLHASFAALQSVCVESVAQPYLQDKVNVSLGCTGSRVLGGIAKDEMVMGIPFAQMGDVIESSRQMFRV
ncbi:DUF169 domain-containing protein [Methanolobus sp.]|uniref:DUF169 domain-containing protein n=1 Tax=Methanolobus sp. TaxID=1874737 RepID=UPI0025EBD159|nr:DUF169 domain-containing protein [Methanolobus sp.]